MSRLIDRINKILGKTILHYKILDDQIDLTFTDGTKVYNLLKEAKWVTIKTELTIDSHDNNSQN